MNDMTITEKFSAQPSAFFTLLMFLTIPMVVFFLFACSALITVLALEISQGSFSLNTVKLKIVSACVPILYLIIALPALACGGAFIFFRKYVSDKQSVGISIIVYLLVTGLWCLFLTYKTTGHIPAVQMLFSGNNLISYEVITAALIFCALLVIAFLGFFPSALLTNSICRKECSGKSIKSTFVLLALAVCLTVYSLMYLQTWMPVIKSIAA